MATGNSSRVIRCRKRIKIKAVAFLGGECVRCGYSKCVEALEFHHRDPTQKDFSLSYKGLYRRFDVAKQELEKCDLLCANCHREVHVEILESRPSREDSGKRQVQWPSREELTLWVASETLVAIAARLGVSRATVRRWCKVLDVPLPPHNSRTQPDGMVTRVRPTLWPSPDKLKVMVWKKPVLQIAKDLGVSDVAVKKHCKKLGISTPSRGYWSGVK